MKKILLILKLYYLSNNINRTNFSRIFKPVIPVKCLLLICFVFSGLLSTAQTNTGTDFWLAESPNIDNRGDFAISIVNSSANTANITITNPVNATVNMAIPPGGLETFTFSTQSLSIQNTGTYINNVYHVTSDQTIVVYTFTPLESNFTNEAALILPTSALGKRYRVGSYVNPLGNDHGSVTGVIATENNTNVQLFNSAGVLVDNVTINQGEFYQRNNGTGVANDMTGWLVLADKNVAAIGGSVCASIGDSTGACDILHEQLIPEESISSEFIACPTRSRPIGCTTNCSPDIFRYVATEDNTTITTSPNVGGGTINAGQFIEISTNTLHTVAATKPIYGYQYLISQQSGQPVANTGDPAMLNIPPVGQFLFDYTFLIPASFPNNFINVVAPSGTNFFLDGSPISTTCDEVGIIGGTTFCCFALPVTAGVHNISGNQQFGLSISGFDGFASYAYSGGLGLQPLNAGCNTGGPYSQETCDIAAFQLDGSATCSNGSTPGSILWSSSNPDVSFSDPSIEDPQAILPDYGTFDITLTVTCADTNGDEETTSCSSTITVTAPDQVLPNAGTDGTLTICAGSTPTEDELFEQLTDNPDTGGIWSGPVDGVYTYTVSVTSPCPLEDTATVTVTENPLPEVSFTAPAACTADVQFYSVSVEISGGTVTTTAGTVVDNGDNIWTISAIPAGEDITLTATDNGCEGTLMVTAPDCQVVDPCADDTEGPMIDIEAQNQAVECDAEDTDFTFDTWLANNGNATASDNSGPVTWSNNLCEGDENALTINGGADWLAFINRFDGPNYAGGNPSDLPSVTTTIMPGNMMVLEPSMVEPNNSLTIEGNTYIQDNSLAGQSFTFSGNVTSNTLVNGYEAVAFIKLFDGGFGFIEQINAPLSGGPFTVAYDNTQPSAVNIQYGFAIYGPGGLDAPEGSLGSVVVEAVEAECASFMQACGETGSATVTFTATDACGNRSSTTATFTIEEDTTPPSLIGDCPTAADFGYSDVASEADLPTGDEAEQAFFQQNIPSFYEDNCSGLAGVNISDPVLESNECGGTATYTIDFADGCDNYNRECTFTINWGSSTSVTAIWTGDIDTAWEIAGNWQDNMAPGLSTDSAITIPSGLTNYPVLVADQDLYISPCSTVTVESGASLTVNPNAVVSNDGTVTNYGTTTFESDDTGSAFIGSGMGMFMGDFTVERYIPANRAFRQLASPVTTSTPISENWQQDTHITGSTTGANGFDPQPTGNPSMYTFNNAAYSYVPMANTDNTNLMPNTMYHILVRGDRSIDITDNNTVATETTLRATGELTEENNGSSTTTINAAQQRFIALGNPFQAPVDMSVVLTQNNTTNISTMFYWVWDPTLGTRGAFTAIVASSGNPGNGSSMANQYLQAGQAGWVYMAGTGSASVSFTQASKNTSGTETNVFKSAGKQDVSVGELYLSLYESSALANNETATDGLLVLFDTEGTNEVDAQDAPKFINLDENFATNNNGTLLSIENRAAPVDAEEIQLEVNTYRHTNYTIVAEGVSMQGATAYLFDAYTNISIEIPQNGTVNYAYTVDSGIPASIAGDRFKINFASIALSVDSYDMEQILLYPNPTSIGEFYLNIPLGMDDLDLTIYNTLGAKFYHETGLNGGSKATINTSFILSHGMYFVKLSSQGKTTTKKLNIN